MACRALSLLLLLPLAASFSFSRSWVHRGVSISSSSSLARRAALSEDVERAKAYLMGGPRPTADGAPAAAPSSPSSSPAPYKWALLFDCDGVIVETEELHRLAYCGAFEAFGLEVEG